jgi:hypothetical protein
MTYDPTQVIAAGNSNCRVWLADVGTAFPATMAAAFASTTGWADLGLLKTAPSFNRATDKTPIEMWNATEAIANILSTETNDVTLNPAQVSPLTLELYFGKLVYSAITGGVHIEPDPAGGEVEKAFCLEVVDGIVGGKVFRVGWRRASVSEVGNINMEKADALNFEMTMTRLLPASGSSFFLDSNIDVLVDVLP